MKIFLSFSAIVCIVAFGACKKSTPAPANNAMVMFVNGCTAQTTTNLDGKLGGTAVSGATNIAYNKNSGYKTVTANASAALSFGITGLGSTLVSDPGTENLAVNGHYTVYAGGISSTPSFVFSTDDLTAPASGNARIRFVNLCADNLNVSCYVGASKVDSNVAYKTCTPFFEVPASTGKVAMIDQVVLTNSAEILSQSLSSGKIYTFIFTGTATATTTAAALTLSVIANN